MPTLCIHVSACTSMKAHSHYAPAQAHSHYAPAQSSGIRFRTEAQVLNIHNYIM